MPLLLLNVQATEQVSEANHQGFRGMLLIVTSLVHLSDALYVHL